MESFLWNPVFFDSEILVKTSSDSEMDGCKPQLHCITDIVLKKI